jgi:hypothetical protein
MSRRKRISLRQSFETAAQWRLTAEQLVTSLDGPLGGEDQFA